MKHTKKQKWLNSAAKKPGALKVWLLLFGVLAMVLSPFAIAQTTHAQGSNPYIAQDVFDDVVSYAYRNAFGACLGSTASGGGLPHIDDTPPMSDRDNNGNGIPDNEEDSNFNLIPDGEEPPTITADAVVDGRWFWGGADVAVTPLVDDDGLRDCNTPALINRAVEHWWQRDSSYNIEGACQLGLIERIDDGEDCVHGSGDFYALRVDRNDVLSAIDAQRWGGDWSWDGPRYYVLYARSMEIGCYATPVIAASEVTSADDKQRYTSEEYVTMQVVGRDGSTTEMIYRLGNGKLRDSKIYTTVSPNAFLNQDDNTCADLARLASQYAPDYAQYVKDNPPADDDPGAGAAEGEGGGENATQCDVEGIGWIVCPAMLFMGDVVDGAYGVVAGFLAVEPVSTDTGGPLFQAWSFMRNFANVAFVIVFLVIIYSQITSVGISNYNIKKMLPRLIVAAILVNVSYWICAIAVDVSNILGASIKDLFDNVSGELFPSNPNLSDEVNQQWSPVVLGIITGAAVGVALYAGLSMLLPLLIGALISVITALIILTLRQALIIILIVLSPIAFVAFLLPNTQSLFDKWRKLFMTLLFMFPLIAIIFGGSALAGLVIQQSAGTDPLLQLLALGVTVIPLFITIFISKMISMIGGVAGRLIGAVNDPTKGLLDRAKRGAEGYRDNRKEYRKLKAMTGYRSLPFKGAAAQRGARRAAVLENRKRELSRATAGYVAETAEGDGGFRDKLAQGGGQGAEARALASAINVQASLTAEEVKADHAIIKDANLDNDLGALQQLAMGGVVNYKDKTGNTRQLTAPQGSSLQTAAIQKQFELGDIAMTDQLVAASGTNTMGTPQRQAIAEGMAKLSSKVKYYGGSGSADVAAGKIKSEADLNKLVADAVAGNKLDSAETLVQSDKDALKRVSRVVADPTSVTSDGKSINAESINSLRDAAKAARTDRLIKKPSGNVMEKIQAIENGIPFK